MKEFVEKLIGRLEELKQTQVKELCEHKDFTSEMQSMRGFNVLQDVIKITNELAEEYNNGWIPYATNEELPTNGQKVWLSFTTEYTSFVKSAYWIYDHFEWANGKKVKDFPSAWKPYQTPAPYQKGE